jgi:hypothetical protein
MASSGACGTMDTLVLAVAPDRHARSWPAMVFDPFDHRTRQGPHGLFGQRGTERLSARSLVADSARDK